MSRLSLAVAFLALCVLCPALAQIKPRLELTTLTTHSKYSKHRDLLIQAVQSMMEADYQDPSSWYQIGGIHGMPASPYNNTLNATSPYNSTNGKRWLGYCEHNSVLFPSWHRPYMRQLEIAVQKAAMRIAMRYTTSRAAYIKAAEDLRWPYWDWARDLPVPEILTAKRINVNAAPNARRKTIDNPFYSYTFQVDTKPPGLDNFPYNNPRGSTTMRFPSRTGSGAMATFDANMVASLTRIRNRTRGWVLDLFKINTWECFAARGTQLYDPSCTFQAFESVHNWVHLYIGGGGTFGLMTIDPTSTNPEGHMSLLQTAAFDPAFFLHHTNLDRLLAIWQALYPGRWVTSSISNAGTFMYDKGQPINMSTPLYPFRITDGPSVDQFYTSIDVYNTEHMGYYYEDLNNPSLSYTDLYARMETLYGPGRSGFRWFLHINCTSPDARPGNFTINANFTRDNTTFFGVADTISDPDLQAQAELQLRSGPTAVDPFSQSTVLATEVTRIMAIAGVNTNPPPINGDPSQGPSTIVTDAWGFPGKCLQRGRQISCTCTKKLNWVIDGPEYTPYDVYKGAVTTNGWGNTVTVQVVS